MPIPSLSSALKPRSQISRPKDTSTRRNEPAENDSLTALPRPTPPSNSSPSNGIKPRSLLPQRGIAKSLLPTAGVESPALKPPQSQRSQPVPSESANAPAAPTLRQHDLSNAQARPRPRSLYQAKPIGPNVDAPTEPASKPLRSAGLRSQMPPPPVPDRTHARTRSTNIVPGARKTSGEVRPRAERPKSMVIPANAVNAVKAAEAHASTLRTSARAGGLTRTASTRVKQEALRDRAATIGATGSEQGRSREVVKEEVKKPARPAFSTLQQHFTPRKTGKAPTNTFLHPAPEPTSQHLLPEIVAMQSELLQLHLLHQASSQTSKKWELSAQQHLRCKFDQVASLYQVMREHERHGLEQKNILALREWNGANSSHTGLAAHIHALSAPLNEFPSLLDPGGRYHRLTHDFHLWLSHVEAVFSLRNNPHQDGSRQLGSIEGLGDWWKEENAVLTRKLTSLLRDLDQLSTPAPGSSIAAIVKMCRELLVGLVEELGVMRMVEREVVDKEKEWVEERLKGIARDIDLRLDGGEVAAWRM